jgi:uncharacterized protein (DUF486 family)
MRILQTIATTAVPANRCDHGLYSATEVITIQEAITLNHVIGFVLIASGAAFIFRA